MNRKLLCAVPAAVLLLGWMSVASAQGDAPYLFGGGLFELNDSSRDSDDGYGLEAGLGLPLPGRSGEAAEFTFKLLERDRDAGGGSDEQYSLFGNWVKSFEEQSLVGGATPYFLAGFGAVQEDVAGDDHLHVGFNTGLGIRLPLPIADWSLRAQAVAQAQLNDDSVPSEDYLLDFHLGLGLIVPLGERSARAAPVEAAPECPVRVVDPVTGRTDCATDSDRDGVYDGTDLCPATPAGSAVDIAGCTVGGVIDADGDGVVDDVDACPGTTGGLIVDGTGCLVEQSTTLRAVRFETDSARLTPDSRKLLTEVARTLKNQPGMKVEIAGHTDDQGSEAYNVLLSQQRAQSVRQQLIGKGVAPERLVARGYGQAQPVAGNDTAEGRDANRRVEFKITLN